jgi:Trypsin
LPVTNNVTEIISHENYRIPKLGKHYDIALLRLEEKVIFNDFVKPICLPLDPKLWEKDYKGLRFTATGDYYLLFMSYNSR